MSRFLGPLVVREVTRSGVFSLITHHDLGILAPFPSKTESEEMIPKNPKISAFLDSAASKNPIVLLAVCCKYFYISALRKLLKRIDIHFVPSSFLVPYIRDIGEIPEEKVVVLEHFL